MLVLSPGSVAMFPTSSSKDSLVSETISLFFLTIFFTLVIFFEDVLVLVGRLSSSLSASSLQTCGEASSSFSSVIDTGLAVSVDISCCWSCLFSRSGSSSVVFISSVN